MMDLEKLRALSDAKVYGQGSVVIKEKDDDTESMFILLKGTVGVIKNYGEAGETKVAVLKPGDFFGEMSLFLNEPRTATIVAQEDIIVLEISRFNAYDFLERQPAPTFSMVRTLCARIMNLTQKLSNFSLEADGFGGAAAGVAAVPAKESAQAEPGCALSMLFPDGHKTYGDGLLKTLKDPALLIPREYQCPLCLTVFKKKIPRASVLKMEKTDNDSRMHYRGIETLYYEVITCPKCKLSTLGSSFAKALSSRERQLDEAIEPFRKAFDFSAEAPTTLKEVFATHYLALLCTPIVFTTITSLFAVARLWHRISWLYEDCGDEEMAKFALTNACEAYVEAYTKGEIPPDFSMRLNQVIGELYFKQQDYVNARKFLFEARKDRNAGVYSRMAEDRLEDIKDIIKQPEGSN